MHDILASIDMTVRLFIFGCHDQNGETSFIEHMTNLGFQLVPGRFENVGRDYSRTGVSLGSPTWLPNRHTLLHALVLPRCTGFHIDARKGGEACELAALLNSTRTFTSLSPPSWRVLTEKSRSSIRRFDSDHLHTRPLGA